VRPVLVPLALLLADPASAIDPAHALFDSTLASFVRDGLVDYERLQDAARDPASAFRRYLDELAAPAGADSAWSRDERLAYWINAYNAFTLKLVTDHWPIATRWWVKAFVFPRKWMPANSILQIPGRWDEIEFDSVRGPITLDAIEHGILRAELEETRIHFAIVCASIGCPRLASRAFRADSVERQLEETTAAFAADPEKVRLDPDTGELRVSKIFDWFREDFDRPLPPGRDAPPTGAWEEDAGVARWLAAYGPPPVRERIVRGPTSLSHLSWDWRLNEQPR